MAMDIRQLVARNVRLSRLARGLTQEALASRAGVSQQYISELERGRRNPTVLALAELAGALNSTPVELITPGYLPSPHRR